MTTRRDFVGKSAQALAGMALIRTKRRRPHVAFTLDNVSRETTAGEVLSHYTVVPEDMKALAHAALDAAKGAGATYADVRIAQRYGFSVSGLVRTGIDADFSYGIRAWVDDANAFTHGCIPNSDNIAQSARNAVSSARGFSVAKIASTELAPVTVATGEWTTPIKTDPFLVPLRDQNDVINSYYDMGERIVPQFFLEGRVSLEFQWTKECRIYASTAGAFVTQTFYRLIPSDEGGGGTAGERTAFSGTGNHLSRLMKPRSGGYELVLIADLPEKLKALAEESSEISRHPLKRLAVGRYPTVVDGIVMASLFGHTVGVGLEADRVLGNETGTTGSSYLAPPGEILNKAVVNPLLNVTATRGMPNFHAVKWDDEGVEPADYPVLKDGVVVNYHADRATAQQLASLPGSSTTAKSFGCAMANDAGDRLQVRMPHIDIKPGAHTASVEDLCQGIKYGVLVTQGGWVSTDHQLASGLVYPFGGEVYEIVNGKRGNRLKNAGLEFGSATLWKNLVAIGDESTVAETNFYAAKSIPWLSAMHTATAPAGKFSAANFVDLSRTIG